MAVDVLGVRIDTVTRLEAREKVRQYLVLPGGHTIFTPNPEMLVAAGRDATFRTILNQGTLNICDGRGVELFAPGNIERIPGIDFLLDLCAVAQTEGKSIYLLGTNDTSIVTAAAETLKQQFPHLRIVGMDTGPKMVVERHNGKGELRYTTLTNDETIDRIILAAPDILFVAFGHEKQERWILEHLSSLPSVKIAMGVGGALDILAGRVRRAPRLFQRLGLEWMWRGLVEPWRWKRLFTALVIFPWYYAVSRHQKKPA